MTRSHSSDEIAAGNQTGPAVQRPRHDREYLVALVGCAASPDASAHRMMAACSVKAVEIAAPADAPRLLETIAFDALVLESRHPQLGRLSHEMVSILDLVRLNTDELGRPAQLLVLASPVLRRGVRAVYVEAGATIIPNGRRSFRHLVNVVRRQCGVPQRSAGENRQILLTIQQSSRHTIVTSPD